MVQDTYTVYAHTQGRDEKKDYSWRSESEKSNFTWRALKRKRLTAKTELLIKNGQTLACPFSQAAQNQYVSYVLRLWQILKGNMKFHYETKYKSFEQTYPLKSELKSQKNILRA